MNSNPGRLGLFPSCLLCLLCSTVISFRSAPVPNFSGNVKSNGFDRLLLGKHPYRVERNTLGVLKVRKGNKLEDEYEDEGSQKEVNDAFWIAKPKWLSVSAILPPLGGLLVGAFGTLFLLFSPVLEDGYYDNSEVATRNNPKDQQAVDGTSPASLEKNVELFSDILHDLQDNYVDKINSNKLFETAMGAMLKSLDPYTEYENYNEAVAMAESVAGKYGGVGLIISSGKETPEPSSSSEQPAKESTQDSLKVAPSTSSSFPPTSSSSKSSSKSCRGGTKSGFCGVTVIDTFENFAYDAGLRIGDRIMAIDGKSVAEYNADQVKNYLRGDPQTYVVVSVEREGVDGLIDVKVKRDVVKMSDIKLASYIGDPKDGIGYINLHGFTANAGNDFRNAMVTLRFNSEAGDLKGLVLDLRGNPGGLLSAAVEVASYLLPKNSDIVSSKSRTGEELIYKSDRDPIRPILKSYGNLPIPVAVLVNSGSASASEIVSGALQDYDAAMVVGPSRTYGKGLVQKIVPLPYNSALKYTIARYYTPSGRCIQSMNYNGGRGEDLVASASPISSASSPDMGSAVLDVDRKSFLTQHGRTVLDGGGIEPDISVDKIQIGPAETMLVDGNMFFRFAGEYMKEHPNLLKQLESQHKKNVVGEKMLAGTEYFALEPLSEWDGLEEKDVNKIFEDFKKFIGKQVASEEFDASSAFQKDLASLKTTFSSRGLKDSAKEVDVLKSSLKKEFFADLDLNKKYIKEDLVFALASRALPDRLLVQRTVNIDPQVNKALELVKDPETYYKSLFKGPALVQVRGTGTGPVRDAY